MSQLARRRVLAAIVAASIVAANATLLGLAGAQVGPPPPTPVPPDGRLSPFPSVLRTPRDPVPAPPVSARAAILADLDDGTVLFRKDAATPRPVASLTKIMTALVVLRRTGLDDVVRVDPRAVFERDDFGAGSTLGLRAGERQTVRDLLYATILGSANDAAEALAIHVAGSVDAFVALMDRRAEALGMHRTSFASPHGLDDRGRSTPEDLLRLVRAAYAEPAFGTFAATRFRRIPAPGGKDRRIQNRNALLWLYAGAFGVKTGTTAGAGACLAAAAERDGRRLVAIVLGADREAFSDAAALLDHGFAGFTERTFVRAGEDAGVVEIRGGVVPVVAASALEGLVPSARLDEVTRSVRVDPDAAFPPAPGDVVATMQVRVPGLSLGTVPLVVARVPAPSPEPGTWWGRGLGAVADAVADAVAAFVG
ncbi:MAG TPA: D-alanyl-D-alanine carboxypeptidase family protein [Actinomycetota bacterium]